MKQSLLIVVIILCASTAYAQTMLRVPLETAFFQWAAPTKPTPLQYGETEFYVIACQEINGNLASYSVSIPAPATTVKLNQVIQNVGVFTCSLAAANAQGESVEVAKLAPFRVGYPAEPPKDFAVRAQ